MGIKNTKHLRLLQGLIISSAAPAGWMLIQQLMGSNPLQHLSDNSFLYIYMWLGTALAFMTFGYVVGESEQKLAEMAITDSLTGLKNSRFFHQRIVEEYARTQRLRQHLALIYIDLDHFSDINSLYGHRVGDDVLYATARSIKAVCRKDEILARVGGEEFCVILSDCGEKDALLAAERFLKAIREQNVVIGKNRTIRTTASAGVVSSETTVGDEWQLYAEADKAMYRAKHAGRNQIALRETE